jgi:hypothetical protein
VSGDYDDLLRRLEGPLPSYTVGTAVAWDADAVRRERHLAAAAIRALRAQLRRIGAAQPDGPWLAALTHSEIAALRTIALRLAEIELAKATTRIDRPLSPELERELQNAVSVLLGAPA